MNAFNKIQLLQAPSKLALNIHRDLLGFITHLSLVFVHPVCPSLLQHKLAKSRGSAHSDIRFPEDFLIASLCSMNDAAQVPCGKDDSESSLAARIN